MVHHALYSVAPAVCYALSDYFLTCYLHTRHLSPPLPGTVCTVSDTVLLLAVYLVHLYHKTRRLDARTFYTPKVSVGSVVSSFLYCVVMRYDLFDLNHNFNVPGYRYLTALLTPLIFILINRNQASGYAAFIVILLSVSMQSMQLSVSDFIFGMFLSVCLYSFIKRLSCEDGNSTLEKGSVTEQMINVMFGVVCLDVMSQLFTSSNTAFSVYGVVGVCLYITSCVSKVILLVYKRDSMMSYLLTMWVVKTMVFSATKQTGYKFDLLIANFVGVIVWVGYLAGGLVWCKMGWVRERVEDWHKKRIF